MILAEKEVLGALFTDSERLKEITFLRAEMFTDSRYGAIFKAYQEGAETYTDAIKRVSAAGRPEDLVTKDVYEILDVPVTLANVKSNAKIIRDEYRLSVAKQIMAENVNSSEVDRYLHKAIRELQNLTVTDAKVKTAPQIAKERAKEYFVPPLTTRVNTGIGKVDEVLCGLDPGDVHIIAARPGVGKSALALQIAKHLSREGKKVAYYNLEMGDKQVYERMLAAESGIALTRIRNATNFLNDESEKFDRANEKIEQLGNLFVITGSRSVDELRVGAERYDVIVVDYLQLLKSDGRRGANRVAEVGDISHGLKNLATDFEIPLIALSQLNRTPERSTDKEPHPSDLRESGDLEQDASTIMMMWNLDKNDLARKGMKIAKARQGENVMIELHFDGAHMTFTETEGFAVDEDDPFEG